MPSAQVRINFRTADRENVCDVDAFSGYCFDWPVTMSNGALHVCAKRPPSSASGCSRLNILVFLEIKLLPQHVAMLAHLRKHT